jgi:hypothetical protein
MVCPKAAYQGRQANAYKHGNDKNISTHIRLTVGIILPVKMLFYHQGNKGGI